jgi:excinuclease ABC subunit C
MVTGALRGKLDNLPTYPGVYLFKDERGKVIYVGKAKRLRSRVRSYFQSSRGQDEKTIRLTESIRDLDYIVTDNEVEALILESSLVKRKKPRFNVHLKDDKSFLHLKLTMNEDYPRVLLTRQIRKDGGQYFGPYLPASLARNSIKIINRHFQLRTCDIEIDGNLDRPCLEYHIKRCLGPCVSGLCSRSEYDQAVQDVVLLLQGRIVPLVRKLKRKMEEASSEQRYEAAAFFRDRLGMVSGLAERQKMVLSGVQDVDVFALHREDSLLALQMFTLRHGKVVGKKEFFWEDLEFFSPREFLRDALQQYYLNSSFVPNEIFLPFEIGDQELVQEWLSTKAERPHGGRVHFRVPKRGDKFKLVQLVGRNAKIAFDTRFRILKGHKDNVLGRIQDQFGLADPPRRIEAFDVSTIQGRETVASMVVCLKGQMEPAEYRKFRIRSVEGTDDFASILEAVQRRYSRQVKEGASLPDLILIDGGKGQLHYAFQALSKLGIDHIPLVSLAKKEEHLFLMGEEQPLVLDRRSPVLQLFQVIRDEAHRFAVSYHRKRRELTDFASELDSVLGIGPKRKKELLREFGSLARIKRAERKDLARVVGENLAEVIWKELREND